MANKIEVNYEDLEALSKRFSQNYDRWHQFVQLLKTRVNHVYATWEGKGADLFEHEMENLVLPAVQRLGNALHAGQDTCKKIGQEFQDCEEEAGNLFKADGDGGSSTASMAGGALGGLDSQFKFFRPGLKFNEGAFPKLGGNEGKLTKFDTPWGDGTGPGGSVAAGGGVGTTEQPPEWKWSQGSVPVGGGDTMEPGKLEWSQGSVPVGGGVGTGEFNQFNQGMASDLDDTKGVVGSFSGSPQMENEMGDVKGPVGSFSGSSSGAGGGGGGDSGGGGGGGGQGSQQSAGGAAGGGGGGGGGTGQQQPQNFEAGQNPQQQQDESGGTKFQTRSAGPGHAVDDEMKKASGI